MSTPTEELANPLGDSLMPKSPQPPVLKLRPAIRRTASSPNTHVDFVESDIDGNENDDGQRAIRRARAREAYERGKRLETDEREASAPNSRLTSPERSEIEEATGLTAEARKLVRRVRVRGNTFFNQCSPADGGTVSSLLLFRVALQSR
jgi:hypothetical protein